MKRSRWRSTFIFCAVLQAGLHHGAAGLDESEVLAEWRRADEMMSRAFTLKATSTPALLQVNPDPERNISQVEITHEDGAWAAKHDLVNTEPGPVDFRPTREQVAFATGERSGVDFDGEIVFRRPLQVHLLLADGAWCVRTQNAAYMAAAGANVTPRYIGSSELVESQYPESPLGDWRLYSTILTTGRGFSRYIDAVKSVAEAGAIIIVEADGTFSGKGKPAIAWRIELEPVSYLVRKATASRPDGRTLAEFETKDTLRSDLGDIAKRGRFKFGGERAKDMYQGDGYMDVVFHSIVPGVNAELADEVHKAFNGDYPAGTNVIDLRTDTVTRVEDTSKE